MTTSHGEDAKKDAFPSTKPYLIRALYQWCVDFQFTPYLSVFVDELVQVPMEYVNKGEIVLNISPTACQELKIDNELISFKARFNGVSREIWIPTSHVMAIYSRENSQGMSFPVNLMENKPSSQKSLHLSSDSATSKVKSHLKLIK
ncbi:MAG: ClpXP protease specificity-enhancing factor [Betaproteobacteria bacterium]|jgi:stringent starvation protein B|nr:ClpXP protease specificity-enhancing factor [Betaproteobacteria bacterium]